MGTFFRHSAEGFVMLDIVFMDVIINVSALSQ